MTNCPQCNGSPMFLGRLGASDAFRCRDCGWDWSEPAESDEDEVEDEDEPEWDGQPDEAQEWHDFDPDC